MHDRLTDSCLPREKRGSRGRAGFPLEPATPAGVRFVELAIEHGELAVEHAARHDRDGTFPVETFDAMRTSGFLKATVPEAHGGLGLNSIHDLTVGLCELARADGSTSLAVNMHLVFGLAVRWLQGAPAWNGAPHRDQLDFALDHLGRGCVVIGNATEVGTDIAHPLTEARKASGGWILSGRKAFGTLSPVADWFVVSCRVRRSDGTYTFAYALLPRGVRGQEIQDNWDGLGMRASGSHDIVYDECFVPGEHLFELDLDWGAENTITRALGIIGNIGLLGTFLGIAEAARDLAIENLKNRNKPPAPHSYSDPDSLHRLVADIDVALASMRAILDRTARLADRLLYPEPPDGPPDDDLILDLSAQFQCAKLLVNGQAVAVVDHALTLTGGAGYMSSHPLARFYRDVRAGPFMQPYSPKEAYGYIARSSMGSDGGAP